MRRAKIAAASFLRKEGWLFEEEELDVLLPRNAAAAAGKRVIPRGADDADDLVLLMSCVFF